MRLKTSAEIDCSASVEDMWALATDNKRFPDFFKGFVLIPAVMQVEVLGEGETRVGTKRKIHNKDGSVITEVVDVFEPHRVRQYRLIDGFTPPFSWLVRLGTGRWEFHKKESGCRVVWHYEFELTSFLVAWIVGPILWLFFKRAMQDCLDRMRDAITLK